MLLSLTDVTKRFGATVALDGATVAIDGRAIGLLGPNGAGKTTLMKLCLGLLTPDAGRVEVLGLDARRAPTAVRARLGYAAEGSGRMPGMSGLESVAYAAELCGFRRRPALLRAHDMLDLVGLDESRYRAVETYSTGMHQRVKIAMALVHDPELVLLDEPTSGLDPKSRDELLDLIVHLRDGGGPAVILSTHLLHDVERTCDACVIMQAGQVRFSGPLSALGLARPGQFEVRTLQPAPLLVAALQARGVTIEHGTRPEVLNITLPPGAGAALIWEAATIGEAAITHLAPRVASLEEAFLKTLAPKPRANWPQPAV